MENWTLFDYLLFAFWLWIATSAFRAFLAMKEVRQKEISDHVETLVKSMVIPSVLEHYKGQVFLYNKETGKFIAQAHTEDELKTKLNQWFPKKAFIVVENTTVHD